MLIAYAERIVDLLFSIIDRFVGMNWFSSALRPQISVETRPGRSGRQEERERTRVKVKETEIVIESEETYS
jgi:hypothetical protein